MSISEIPHSSTSENLQCPVVHSSHQKTARFTDLAYPAIEQDEKGTWHIRNFDLVRTILRSSHTKQAGFKAETFAQIANRMNPPILFQDGKAHQQQRKQTARFFTPKAVTQNYRQLMETLSDSLIDELRRKKRADLAQLSLTMAVQVAAHVVGLTNSNPHGMAKRLDRFFEDTSVTDFRWTPAHILALLRNQYQVLSFFNFDVKPAIKARKRTPKDDLITHLISLNYKDTEILTECVTFGAAGMATTREFISIATWHFLEQPKLKARYLVAPEEERYAILHEILRLEPVVSNLFRRTTAEITLTHEGNHYIIPSGSLVDLHIYSANSDEKVTGDDPLLLCPARELKGERTNGALMSFGDGTHRCPGAYIAIQETDIFLQKLLALDGLHIERKPDLSWKELIFSYELRNFVLAIA